MPVELSEAAAAAWEREVPIAVRNQMRRRRRFRRRRGCPKAALEVSCLGGGKGARVGDEAVDFSFFPERTGTRGL